MGTSLCVFGRSNNDSPEFQKHLKAVKFCIENELSFPAETSEFFKGKVDECDLEDYSRDYILEHIENGIHIELPAKDESGYGYEYVIKVADIPEGVNEIVAKLC